MSTAFDVCIVALICITIVSLSLDTVESIRVRHGVLLHRVEIVSLIVFTVEYLLRAWSYVADPAYSNPIRGRLRFARTPLVVVDLLAIAPLLLTMWLGGGLDTRFIRVLRLFRLMRLMKLTRYSKSIRMLGRIYNAKKSDLVIVFVGQFVALLLVSDVMWIVEGDVQPEAFSNIP